MGSLKEEVVSILSSCQSREDRSQSRTSTTTSYSPPRPKPEPMPPSGDRTRGLARGPLQRGGNKAELSTFFSRDGEGWQGFAVGCFGSTSLAKPKQPRDDSGVAHGEQTVLPGYTVNIWGLLSFFIVVPRVPSVRARQGTRVRSHVRFVEEVP